MLEARSKTQKSQSLFLWFALTGLIISLLSCRIALPINIKASDPKIGTEINQENGRLIVETTIVPTDKTRIYFEFFLDIPENVDVLLEFRWYRDSELIISHTGRFVRGYTVAFIDNDQSSSSSFSSGNYIVEVWFQNQLLISKSFTVN